MIDIIAIKNMLRDKYDETDKVYFFARQLFAEAVEAIEQLEVERDAAVEDLKNMSEENGDCSMCSHYAKNDSDYFPDCDSCPCDNGMNKWEWRGVKGGHE